MANVDKAFGLRPVRKLDGSPWNASVMQCHVPGTDSTVIGIGDPVKLAGSGGAVGSDESYPTVARCAAGDAVFGIMVGVVPTKYDESEVRTALTAMDIIVVPAKNLVCHIQCDGSVAATDYGNTADFVVTGDASSVTGMSQVELDSSNIGTGTGLRILKLADIPGNALGANAIVEVLINESQLADSVAGV